MSYQRKLNLYSVVFNVINTLSCSINLFYYDFWLIFIFSTLFVQWIRYWDCPMPRCIAYSIRIETTASPSYNTSELWSCDAVVYIITLINVPHSLYATAISNMPQLLLNADITNGDDGDDVDICNPINGLWLLSLQNQYSAFAFKHMDNVWLSALSAVCVHWWNENVCMAATTSNQQRQIKNCKFCKNE